MADYSLTGELIMRKVWSPDDQAFRMIPAANTSFAIELDAADGDNVQTIPKDLSNKISITVGSQLVSEAFDVKSIKTINLYSKTLSTLQPIGSDVVSITLEVSPSDIDDIWITIPLSIEPGMVQDSVMMGKEMSIVARRARVVCSQSCGGEYDIYVVGHAV